MKISVIVPTLNEECCVAENLSHIRSTSEQKTTEIIVSDGGSADRTKELARRFADKVLEVSTPGRARQMHEGARMASGELLLFLHVDTHLPQHWEQQIKETWIGQNPPIATAFRLGFDQNSLVYRFLALAANTRTSWTGVPHGDQALALHRKTYFDAGGFPAVPLFEEYELIRKLKPLGPVKILPTEVMTSARRYLKNPLVQGLRNNLLISMYYFGISPKTLTRLYR